MLERTALYSEVFLIFSYHNAFKWKGQIVQYTGNVSEYNTAFKHDLYHNRIKFTHFGKMYLKRFRYKILWHDFCITLYCKCVLSSVSFFLNIRHVKHKLEKGPKKTKQNKKNTNSVFASQHKVNVSTLCFRSMTHSVHQQH